MCRPAIVDRPLWAFAVDALNASTDNVWESRGCQTSPCRGQRKMRRVRGTMIHRGGVPAKSQKRLVHGVRMRVCNKRVLSCDTRDKIYNK